MGRSRIIFLASLEETLSLGKQMGSLLPPNSLLALQGDLGVGKTTFTQGLAVGLGITAPIQSPTFVYLNVYEGALPLFHFDLYRLKEPSDFLGLGFEEYLNSGGICAIEWPERIKGLLPKDVISIKFKHLKEDKRSLSIKR